MNEERIKILKMVEEGDLSAAEALQLLEELEAKQKKMEQKKEDLIEELSAASGDNTEHEQKHEHEHSQSHYKYQSAVEKIFDFVDTSIKKLKEVDLDFNFGKSVEFTHVFQHADADIQQFDVDIANGSVKLIPWEQKDVRIECEAKIFRAGTTEEAREKFLKDVVFVVEGSKLKFFTQQKWMKLNAAIYFPQAEYDKIKVRLFNGKIEAENVKAKQYKAKTANGRITIDTINSANVEISTGNGKVIINNGYIDDLEVETLNGKIVAEGDFKTLDAESFNGNVYCTLTGYRTQLIDARAATGNIELNLPGEAAVKGELKTNVGGFDILLDGIQITEEKRDVVQKKVRFKTVKEAEHVIKMTANTNTGTITVKRAAEENK
ncbi:DUF4097 domain-containing protein [Bacillaceae bacterium Marseille-Q3522]|nr:DUF4097 domain-containing protein [Bacillaceae bacterium Marseille-Q3522]